MGDDVCRLRELCSQIRARPATRDEQLGMRYTERLRGIGAPSLAGVFANSYDIGLEDDSKGSNLESANREAILRRRNERIAPPPITEDRGGTERGYLPLYPVEAWMPSTLDFSGPERLRARNRPSEFCFLCGDGSPTAVLSSEMYGTEHGSSWG